MAQKNVICSLLLILAACLSAIAFGNNHSTRVTREDYYRNMNDVPNKCSIAFKSTTNGKASLSTNHTNAVPFMGTSLVRDGQLLLLRLYYSMDYPVKYFIVVVSEKAWSQPSGGLGYQLQHLKEYGRNAVVVTCKHPPAVSEGWNAILEAFPDEPWGMIVARDTAFMPGSVQNLAKHMYRAVEKGGLDVALTNWTMNMKQGEYNAFAMTRSAIDRFGLFDENIYPVFYEDNDFQLRQTRMKPPLKVKVLKDVVMLHNKGTEGRYISGQYTHDALDKVYQRRHTGYINQRAAFSQAYLYKKWGCRNRRWLLCAYKTPFNMSKPVWYWKPIKRQITPEHRGIVRRLTSDGLL